MLNSMLRRLFVVLAICFVFAATAHGEKPRNATWDGARAELVNAKQKLYVVTIAHPKRRHTCVMQSISYGEIVCVDHGQTTAYRAEDVQALILPGSHTRWYLYFAGFLAAGGAATWGTVVLSSVCVPCAAGTGVAAFLLFMMSPLTGMATDGDVADTLLYLAPGQTLKVNLE